MVTFEFLYSDDSLVPHRTVSSDRKMYDRNIDDRKIDFHISVNHISVSHISVTHFSVNHFSVIHPFALTLTNPFVRSTETSQLTS